MSEIPMFDLPDNSPDAFNKMWAKAEDALGFNDMNMRRDRPYYGQPQTDTGERGRTEIKGITFRDLRDCFIRAVCMAGNDQFPDLGIEAEKGENAALCENDVIKFDWNHIDPMAVFQQLSCEVERLMGIFPNVPPLDYE